MLWVSGVRHRLAGAAATWIAVLAVVGAAVHPERCPSASPAAARQAVEAAVGWFRANIDEQSGRFRYGYDAEAAADIDGYNDPRHAGALFSLYQAEAADIAGAAAIADKALTYVDLHTHPTADGAGAVFGPEHGASTGATALLVAALGQRRRATGDTSRDADMDAYGRALLGTVTDRGAVEAVIDATDGAAGARSPFATGQVMYALSVLEPMFPERGYGAAAQRILHYLATERDDAEEQFPMLSDHWASYGLVAMGEWESPPVLNAAARAWIERQLGLFGVQVRYESQRQEGITTLTRGPVAMPGGLGTLGEGLGNMARVVADRALIADGGADSGPATDSALAADTEVDADALSELHALRLALSGRPADTEVDADALSELHALRLALSGRPADIEVDADALSERMACAAGMLIERQVLLPDRYPEANPAAVAGAWFRLGVTRMDDQQHTLSALILLAPYLGP